MRTTPRALRALSLVAVACAAAAYGTTTDRPAGHDSSPAGLERQLQDVFRQAEATLEWPAGYCATTYSTVAGLAEKLAGAAETDALHRDAAILRDQARAVGNECAVFDSGERPAQLENRYLRADMQIWSAQLRFDDTHPDNDAGVQRAAPNGTIAPAPAGGYTPLATYRDCAEAYCSEFVPLPAGTFQMGGDAEEHRALEVDDYRAAWESPKHEVRIGTPFAMTATEITREQFDAFVRDTGYRIPQGCIMFPAQPDTTSPTSSMWNTEADWQNPHIPQTPTDPVVCVSRSDAEAYAQWLSRKTGSTYRLPTEAEWEYAARAGTDTPFFWGSNVDDGCAFAAGYDSSTAQATGYGFPKQMGCDDGAAYTRTVGSYQPNPWGLYDITGNAREFVADAWEPNLNTGPVTEAARTGGVAQFPVLRGGGWDYMPQNLRVAYRSAYYSQYIRSYMWGFRLVREL